MTKAQAVTQAAQNAADAARASVMEECVDKIDAAIEVAVAHGKTTGDVSFRYDAGPGMNDALATKTSEGWTFDAGSVTADGNHRVYSFS